MMELARRSKERDSLRSPCRRLSLAMLREDREGETERELVGFGHPPPTIVSEGQRHIHSLNLRYGVHDSFVGREQSVEIRASLESLKTRNFTGRLHACRCKIPLGAQEP